MKKNVQNVLKFIVKVLKAILYVLSAGHLCACKCHKEETSETSEEEANV
jgi:hypothetical protein